MSRLEAHAGFFRLLIRYPYFNVIAFGAQHFSRWIQFFLIVGQNNIENKIQFFFQANKLRRNFIKGDFKSHLVVTLT